MSRKRARGRRGQRDRLVETLRARDGDSCCFCGCTMDFGKYDSRSAPLNQATIEHVILHAEYGLSTPDNTKLACRGCNQERGRQVQRENQIWKTTGYHVAAIAGLSHA